MNLTILKHKPRQLEQYIVGFNALTCGAGYVSTGDEENPILHQLFLEHLNPELQSKIKEQKESLEKLADVVDDAKNFDKS